MNKYKCEETSRQEGGRLSPIEEGTTDNALATDSLS